MAIDTQELRRKVNSTDVVDHIDLHANIKPFLSELLDRIEVAEKDAAHQKALADSALRVAEGWERVAEGWEEKCNALRAENAALIDDMNLLRYNNMLLHTKIADMERQEPVMWANSSNINSSRINKERGGRGDQHTCSETQTTYHDTPLYALPGAKGEAR